MNMPTALRTLNAEVRALEAGRVARAQADGSMLVHSELGDTNYRVTFYGDTEGLVRFTCTCPFGDAHPNVLAGCKHMAAAGRSLRARGLATQDAEGLFHIPAGFVPPAEADSSDPFAGLPS